MPRVKIFSACKMHELHYLVGAGPCYSCSIIIYAAIDDVLVQDTQPFCDQSVPCSARDAFMVSWYHGVYGRFILHCTHLPRCLLCCFWCVRDMTMKLAAFASVAQSSRVYAQAMGNWYSRTSVLRHIYTTEQTRVWYLCANTTQS